MDTKNGKRTCGCGCKQHPKVGRFMPGHDAILRSRLITRLRGSNVSAKNSAKKLLGALGWKLRAA